MQTFQKIILLFLCIGITGCYEKPEEEKAVAAMDTSVLEQHIVDTWQKTEERVAIVFGYGYTDSPFYEELLSSLQTTFGLDSEGGLILPLAFPDDFTYDGIEGRISSLPDIIADKKIKALITLGAPESTHRALAIIQDRAIHDAFFDFPVFSLFPQDDILGIEAGSHVVINFAPFGSAQGMGEEAGLQHMDLIPLILAAVLKKVRDFPKAASSYQIQKYLGSLLGTSWQVELNVDPETSLRSKNHFLISLIESTPVEEPLVSGLSVITGK